MDQMARMKFRLLYLLFEICELSHACGFSSRGGVVAPGKRAGPPLWEHSGVAPWRVHVLFSGGEVHGSETLVGAINVALSITHVSVSVANNFIHSPTEADQGYHAFGELARFKYCLLQKIKEASSLPLVEQWEEYVVSNHSRFAPIDDKHFLEGTRVLAALGKVGSHSSGRVPS